MSLVLKEIRRKNKLTQAEFAEKVGITRSAIAQIESGKNNISTGLAKKIAKLFEVSIDDLINNDHSGIMSDLYHSGTEDEIKDITESFYYQITDINLTIDQIEITKIAIKQFGNEKKLNWEMLIEDLERKMKSSGFYDILKEFKTRTSNDTLNAKFLKRLQYLCDTYRKLILEELYRLVTFHYGSLNKYYDDLT